MKKHYTIGYGGWSHSNWLEAIKKAGIDVMVDVRRHPNRAWSGLYKQTGLKRRFSEAGVRYGICQLVAPSSILLARGKQQMPVSVFMAHYLEELQSKKREVKIFIETFNWQKDSICLMCAEKMPQNCHRSFLAGYITSLSPAIKFSHLIPTGEITLDPH